MNDNVVDPALNQTDPQEMLNKLRNKAGQWHQLAKLLPVLYAKGFDSNTIAEITGLNPLEQNSWVVAGTVYDSVAASNKVRVVCVGGCVGKEGVCAAAFCVSSQPSSGKFECLTIARAGRQQCPRGGSNVSPVVAAVCCVVCPSQHSSSIRRKSPVNSSTKTAAAVAAQFPGLMLAL